MEKLLRWINEELQVYDDNEGLPNIGEWKRKEVLEEVKEMIKVIQEKDNG